MKNVLTFLGCQKETRIGRGAVFLWHVCSILLAFTKNTQIKHNILIIYNLNDQQVCKVYHVVSR